MRFVFTVLIFIVRICCFGAEPQHKPVLKRIAAKQESPKKPDLVTGITAEPPMPIVQIPIDKTAEEAIRLSEEWRNEFNLPTRGANGAVLYQYGKQYPVLPCRKLTTCWIDLQPGEKTTGEPHIGDVRWTIAPTHYGDASGEPTNAVIVKPAFDPDGKHDETTLLIFTDRRAYSVRLKATAESYVDHIAFQYPEDEATKWQQTSAKPKEEIKPVIAPADRLNFGYRVSGGKDWMRPVRVYDDGSKTYLQMPPEMASREAPALLVIGDDGKGTLSNYRVKQDTYILDQLIDHARLVLGAGKKAKHVEITREGRG